jgi:nicotinamide mononucleotide adenylyltransferase
MKLDVPAQLFKGKPENLTKGAISSIWKKQLSVVEPYKDLTTVEDKFQAFKNFVLSIESVYGGKTEGVVIKRGDEIIKVLQADQHDKEVRMTKKNMFKMEPELENIYWEELYKIADMIIKDKINYEAKYEQILAQLNAICYGWSAFPNHTKRFGIQLQDDLFETAKTKLMRKLPGNNNALFIGRLQPPTAMHMKIIENGLATYDNVVVGLVKSKTKKNEKSPFPFELQVDMIKAKFPNVQIVQVGNGNVVGIIQKIQENINVILAGSDRIEGYEKQLERQLDMHVEETKRDYSGISGTKARDAIVDNDIIKFKENMDKTSWPFFDKLRAILNTNESLKEHLSFAQFSGTL